MTKLCLNLEDRGRSIIIRRMSPTLGNITLSKHDCRVPASRIGNCSAQPPIVAKKLKEVFISCRSSFEVVPSGRGRVRVRQRNHDGRGIEGSFSFSGQ